MYMMLLVTLTIKERWKAAKCHRRGILTEVTYFGSRPFLGAHNDLIHSVTFTPSSRPPPSPPPRQLTRSGRNRKTKQTNKNKQKTKLAGDWKVNLASTGFVLRRKRRGFTHVHSDFSVHRLTFSWHGWHNKPSKEKMQERQSVSCQVESNPTTRPWSTKRWPVLFMWNYGRHTGNQLAASKSENLPWRSKSRFVYK